MKKEFIEKEISGVKIGYLRPINKMEDHIYRYTVSLYYKNEYDKQEIIAENDIDLEDKLNELVYLFKLNKNSGRY